MSPRPTTVLIVDDDPDLRAIVSLKLRRRGLACREAGSAAELWLELERHTPDLLLLDVMLGADDGTELVAEVKQQQPALPVIMITRSTSVDAAVRSMRRGASDYITKPLDFDRLQRAVSDALEVGRVARRAAIERAPEPSSDDGFHGLIGRSVPMRQIFRKIDNLAPTDASALILGETGTGKELVAGAIHQASARRQGPFVAVNAAAIPHELIESALFGHRKGAFTGAHDHHIGYCEQAAGGTLFLDEIAEMSYGVQAKLLRFLQDHVVQQLGSGESHTVDLRVLAATNADPLASGKLRQDLYYRLRVVSLRLPPLRQRAGDIELLARHFLHRAAHLHGLEPPRLTPSVIEALEAYAWPGNVRELQHVMEEVVVLHRGETLEPSMLAEELAAANDLSDSALKPALSAPERREKRQVAEALERARGNPENAADELGMSRATIYRKIKKYGLRR